MVVAILKRWGRGDEQRERQRGRKRRPF
jgi:hypothetical protein